MRAIQALRDSRAEVVARYEAGETPEAIGRTYGAARKTVANLLKASGVALRGRRRHTLDESFFDAIDTEEKAYWLGFIAADGNVHRATLTLGLAPVDGPHLQGLIRAIGGTQTVATRLKVDGHHVSTLKVNSARMVRALARWGIVPRKSLILEWPPLSQDAVGHFLRGYIDGDGSWHWRMSRTGRPTWVVSVVGSEPFIRGAMSALITGCDLRPVVVAPTKTPGLARLQYGGNRQLARIYRFLYEGATVYLPRKEARARTVLTDMR